MNPPRRSTEKPNQNFRMPCHEIQNVAGHGGNILSTLANEVVKFQIETVDVAKSGLEMVFDVNWPDDMGSFSYVFTRDLWISTHRNYFESLQKRQVSGRQSNGDHTAEGEIRESIRQFGNFCEGGES